MENLSQRNIHIKVMNAKTGEFNLGKKQGKGVLTFSSGESYDGYFLNDLKHGKGV